MIDEHQTRLDQPPAERVDRSDLAHVVRVLWRWRLLVAAGTLFFVAASFALLSLTKPQFESTRTLLVDQPSLVATGSEGRGASAKILQLTATFARIATSDAALTEVKEAVGTSASIPTLRSRVRAGPVPNEMAIRITARDEKQRTADRLADATATAFRGTLAQLQSTSDVPSELRYVVTPLEREPAERPSQHRVRTLLLAGMLGFAVMAAAAFLLEYIDRP